jgi:hypothetical protein
MKISSKKLMKNVIICFYKLLQIVSQFMSVDKLKEAHSQFSIFGINSVNVIEYSKYGWMIENTII